MCLSSFRAFCIICKHKMFMSFKQKVDVPLMQLARVPPVVKWLSTLLNIDLYIFHNNLSLHIAMCRRYTHKPKMSKKSME